ncbi:MAG: HAMP domain-containing sensor histidine kinase [Ilumatobacteraceae bacterium]
MRIGGRVNLLIAVPLLALIAVSALGYVALQRASVRGEDYQALKAAQEVRADTLPPPATLLEAWTAVNRIGVIAASEGFDAQGTVTIGKQLVEIDRARQDFATSMARWSDAALPADVHESFVVAGSKAGDEFFAAVDDQLLPAIHTGKPEQVLKVVAEMQPLYEQQRVAASTGLFWAENEVIAKEQATDDFIDTVMLYGAAGAALLVLATLLLSVRVRRSIVRPIRNLAEHATAVATHDLPEAVAAVASLPADAPVPTLRPFEVDTRDELADLAHGFNSVQDAAVDLAADQARTRRVVSENIVNIARRNQALLGRTLGFISTLEQGERDPATLDNLFRIDHLATRMRRNAQSLLVLAGDEPKRLWAQPVPIGDVVRAALSEVENYGQVEIGDVGSVFVQGALAPEISHLMAELLENATSFSPPTTIVTVVGRTVPDGHQLAIFDHGLGMTDVDLAAANERLNTVSSMDKDSNKMLGFQVVARLAARHGIKVMLTSTPGGTGVTAIIRLPNAVLEDPAARRPEGVLADVGQAAAGLTAQLPVVEHVTVAPVTMADIEPHMITGELALSPVAYATPSIPTPAPVPPVAPVMAPAAPALTADGLPKRVRGAQLPDTGSAALDAPPVRAADEVRDSLASLQRGIDLGRRDAQS